MKQTILIICIFICACNTKNNIPKTNEKESTEKENNKIKVLNFGTFHFGHTSDANKTDFDEDSEAAQKEIREISKMIATFHPTIICVEMLPESNAKLNAAYQDFLKNPDHLNAKNGEISMIAFDVARLCHVEKLYGIDNHMGYNYSVGDFIESSPEYENSIDAKTYLQLTNDPFKDYPELAAREKKL